MGNRRGAGRLSVLRRVATLTVVAAMSSGCAALAPPKPDLPHFRCYVVTGPPPGQTVKLSDQFFGQDPPAWQGQVRDYRYLCAPVEKTIVEGRPLPVRGPLDHLVCYLVTGPSPGKGAVVDNQLDGRWVPIRNGELLCVPSTKTDVGPLPPQEEGPPSQRRQ